MHTACHYEGDHLLPFLLKWGLSVNARTECVKDSSLFDIDLLLLGLHYREGCTALHYAAYMGRTQAVRLLLSFGANPTFRSASASFPIQYFWLNNGITERYTMNGLRLIATLTKPHWTMRESMYAETAVVEVLAHVFRAVRVRQRRVPMSSSNRFGR
jgi:hypothetical protein